MRNPITWIALIVLIALGGFLLLRSRPNEINTPGGNQQATTTSPDETENSQNQSGGGTSVNPQKNSDIVINSPKPGDVISSPLKVSGKAKGSWYFEASAPVKVTDASGKVLGTGHIQADGEWMTTDFVPFTGTIDFKYSTSTATSSSGFVIFNNDNPSGNPELEKTVSIPIYFK